MPRGSQGRPINGRAIREWRQNRDLTLADLAEQVAPHLPTRTISVHYLSMIERGVRPTVSTSTYRAIQAATGIADLTPDDADYPESGPYPLSVAARLAGWPVESLIEACRGERVEHINVNGYRVMTREQVRKLIDAHTVKAKTPLTEEEQVIAAYAAKVTRRHSNRRSPERAVA